MAIEERKSVKTTEIKGMVKKGGVVEVQMKIGERYFPQIKRGSADLVILLSSDLKTYAKTFGKKVFFFSKKEMEKALKEVPLRYVNIYFLGIFLAKTHIFDIDKAIKVLNEENKKALLKGYNYVQSR
ncbi:MAG: Pyruvate:ferredoxin oxidoreductase or related 2-oxoacid:ferredoxin oxidoreductase [Thermodesulfobacterium sp.]|uniref:Pyruvate:ferredoxin oxidoreductase or related 2-oxoacid:ferredoxin oxidoreductase n=1 Tax=Candidatus Thermodesulfobacterium syntrophicum TaxID=3060442 RepID=A0AAE3P369_9BACT|nr:Pyruvate:ferredoxin oxidoreductase or related 2-oxoacid:ferredoxin oxidoreductase [Candidatus Thermodesulfobacterium syntrophicum]